MAGIVELRNYLQNIIGLGADAQGLERANAIIDEGISSMDDFADFDKEDMVTLCTSVRKPGGTIPDPANATRTIANPGHSIPSMCESRLILAAYGASLYTLINRLPITANSLSRNRLKQFKLHRDMVENHTSPEDLPEISKNFGIMKFLDQFPAFLREVNGVQGVPLSYVIRTNATPPPVLNNLINNVPWSDGHASLAEELIEYVPHSGPSFDDDNAAVFRMIQEVIKTTQHISSITRFQRNRDGRGAFLALQLHNMGNSKWDKVIENAEIMVNQKVWNGRNARYPLKFHITKHREAQNDFQRASQNVTYVPPDENTRVRRLLNSIQCNDSAVISAKTAILADPVKRGDFEQASDFLLLAAPSGKVDGGSNHRISALKRKKAGKGASDEVEDRYYKRHEYVKLSSEQKLALKKMRKGKKKDDQKNDDDKHRIAALEKQLEEQAKDFERKIAALKTEPGSDDLPPAPQGNPLEPPQALNQRGGRRT